MSNYRYLRDIIEKIAEKGKLPKKDIADTMRYVRGSSDRIKDVDNYVNNPMLEDVRNRKDLDDYISDLEEDRAVDDYEERFPGYYINPSEPTHNKYSKYMPIRRRIKEREEVLRDMIQANSENEEKSKLYEALLERLENHPLYDERKGIWEYI